MSEVLNAEATRNDDGGFSRRRVMKGVAWTVPVLVTAIGVPAASASGGPTPPAVTPASASFVTGPQPMPSTHSGGGQDRADVSVPITLSLKDLGGVIGTVEVRLTISPVVKTPAAPVVSLATVRVGSTPLQMTNQTSGPFAATFSFTPTGASLDFTLGYSYDGKRQDSGTYAVTTVITIQEGGKIVQLNPSSTIVLVKL